MRYIFYITLLCFLSLGSNASSNASLNNYVSGDFNFNLDDIVPGDTFDTQESVYISNVFNHRRILCNINGKNATNGRNFTAQSGNSTFTITVYFPKQCNEGYNTLRITGTVPDDASIDSIYIEELELEVEYKGKSD